MELDTSYIVLTMAQAHDLSFFRIDRRNFQTIREVFLGDRPRMITPNTYTRFQSLEDRIFSDNPYIGDFYEDMNRWSFNLQMYFLGSRIQQTMDMLSDGGSGVIFQDRTVYEDAHIFAGNLHEMGLMPTRDIETYMKIFRLVTELIPKPDLLIYLKASVPTLISQIRKRGREYEMNIDELYLKRLNDKYNNWIDNIYEGDVLVVDKDHEDFISDPAVLDKICARLDALNTRK